MRIRSCPSFLAIHKSGFRALGFRIEGLGVRVADFRIWALLRVGW